MMRPVLIGEEHYIDGGISNNLPFSAFEGVNPSSVLMLNLVGFTGVANPLANPMAYTYAVLSTFVAPYNFVKLLMKTYPYVIMMDKCPIQFVPLSFGDQKIVVKSCKKDVEDTIVYGYETLYESLKSKLTPPGQT
jgi:predicted patatin/cPLA2 family phospholipase